MTTPTLTTDSRRHHPAVVLAHQYSEWLDAEGLLPPHEHDERTHDDLVAAFLDARPEGAWPVVDRAPDAELGTERITHLVELMRGWARDVLTLARHSVASPNAKDAASDLAGRIGHAADGLAP